MLYKLYHFLVTSVFPHKNFVFTIMFQHTSFSQHMHITSNDMINRRKERAQPASHTY